jgi:tetratricopeptide (TPR) repeat protein
VNRERGRELEFEEILGFHLEQAYRYRTEIGLVDDEARAVGERAAMKLSSAGRRALERGDLPAAVNLLRRAVDLLPREFQVRIELMVDLGDALLQQGLFDEATSILDEADAIARELDDERLVTRVRLLQLAIAMFGSAGSVGPKKAMEEADQAIATLSTVGDHAGLARAWRLLMNTQATLGHLEEAAAAAEQLIVHATAAEERRLAARSTGVIAYILGHGPTPALEAIERSRQLMARVEGDRKSEAVLYGPLSQLYAMQGDFGTAREYYQRGQAMLLELGAGIDSSSTSIDSARVELLAGDLGAAERELRRDHDTLATLGERYYRSTIAAMLAEVLWRKGDLDDAASFAAIAADISDEDDVLSQVTWRGARAKVLAARGKLAEAEELARGAVALVAETSDLVLHADALMDLAIVLEGAGREEETLSLRQEAAGLYERKGDLVSAGFALQQAPPAISTADR